MNAPIDNLSNADMSAILAFSRALESDETPCSFWGLTPERVRSWLSDPARAVLVMRSPSALLGVASFVRGGDYQEHLAEVSVAVCPTARRSGVAATLLRALEASGRAEGIALFKALIWVRNAESRAFFTHQGYVHRTTLYAEFMSDRFGEIDDCVYYKRLDGRPLPSH